MGGAVGGRRSGSLLVTSLLNATSLDFAIREEGLRSGLDIDGACFGEARDRLLRMVGPDFEGVVLLATRESAWDMDGS